MGTTSYDTWESDMNTILKIILVVLVLWFLAGYVSHPVRKTHILKALDKWEIIVQEGLAPE